MMLWIALIMLPGCRGLLRSAMINDRFPHRSGDLTPPGVRLEEWNIDRIELIARPKSALTKTKLCGLRETHLDFVISATKKTEPEVREEFHTDILRFLRYRYPNRRDAPKSGSFAWQRLMNRLIDLRGFDIQVEGLELNRKPSHKKREPDWFVQEVAIAKANSRQIAIAGGASITVSHKSAPSVVLRKTWNAHFGCNKALGFSGRRGSERHPNGDFGPKVTAYVTRVSTRGVPEAVLVWAVANGKRKYNLFDPRRKVEIYSAGGDGAPGVGRGRYRGGGNGGDGGSIIVHVDQRYPGLKKRLKVAAYGGRGGAGAVVGRDGRSGRAQVKVSDLSSVLPKIQRGLTKGIELRHPTGVKLAPEKAKRARRRRRRR